MTEIPQWLIEYEKESLNACLHEWEELANREELYCPYCESRQKIPKSTVMVSVPNCNHDNYSTYEMEGVIYCENCHEVIVETYYESSYETEFSASFRIEDEVYTVFATGKFLLPKKPKPRFLEDAWNAVKNKDVAEIHVYEDGTVWRYYSHNQRWQRIDVNGW